MKKLWKLVSVVLCGVMLLTGCGSKKNNNGSLSGLGASKSEIPLSSAFSTDRNAIWYYVDTSESSRTNLGKDSCPDEYYIFNNGTLTCYSFSESNVPYSLGELSRMTDEEIINGLETKENEAATGNDNTNKLSGFLEECNQTIAYLEQISEYNEEIDNTLTVSFDYSGTIAEFIDFLIAENRMSGTVAEAKKIVEQYKSFLESLDLNASTDTVCTYNLSGFAVYTDATGNNVTSEEIAWKRITSFSMSDRINASSDIADCIFRFNYSMADISEDNPALSIENNLNLLIDTIVAICESEDDDWLLDESEKEVSYIDDISGSITNVQVYDAWFGGYRCEDGDGYLVTRAKENTNFVLDSLDTPNIVIDPRNHDWAEE